MKVTPRARGGLLLAVLILTAACRAADRDQPPMVSAGDRVKALADAFLEGWFERNPDQGTYYGVPGGLTIASPTIRSTR